jgi:hypothetical protein
MALLPTIPTSFVPRMPVSDRPHVNADFGTLLALFSYIILGAVVFMALGVFFYGRILAGTIVSKDAALAKAEAAIDPATVESFVKLRDRLTIGQTLLSNHLAPSEFFKAIEAVLPATVRFTELHLTVDTTGAAKVDGSGVAKSFNALSAASTAFATDPRIKDVIFSKMIINRADGSVSFGFSATLDPKLIAFSPDVNAGGLQPTATTTP